MDEIENYRQIIERLLEPFTHRRYSNVDIINEAVFDRARDRYLIMQVGWGKQSGRIHGCLIHLDIIDGKIWIQRDGTEDGIGYDLEAAGVAKPHIIPAFYSEETRVHMGYGVK